MTILSQIIRSTLGLVVLVFGLGSCTTIQDIVYLQQIPEEKPISLQAPQDIRLEPGDQLSISIHGRDPKVVEIYNMPTVATSTGGSTKANYTVNANGQIDMIQLRDPVVVVDFATMSYSVLGEVASPGRKPIDRDHITIMDALAQAGDLTIQGKRKNVLVLRNEQGKQTAYRIDLTNPESVYSSPVYNLKQNDIIYVEPTAKKANESDNNANTLRTPAFWLSLFTFTITLVALFKK